MLVQGGIASVALQVQVSASKGCVRIIAACTQNAYIRRTHTYLVEKRKEKEREDDSFGPFDRCLFGFIPSRRNSFFLRKKRKKGNKYMIHTVYVFFVECEEVGRCVVFAFLPCFC